MIKTRKCKECGKNPRFSKGLCKVCLGGKQIKSNSILKSSGKIKQQTVKNKKYRKARTERRNAYFDHHIKKCFKSEESGVPISNPTRSNICHLFDKGRHPSLEDNLDNYIYLTFKEHEVFDSLLFKHDFDSLEKIFKNSWDICCKRFEKLLNLSQENTVLTRALNIYLNERIKSK
ncbi:MAG: hypothetical protein CMH22_06210 [Methylophaga sp.]|nr:hypothetical protein [Methylophaga sp.]|tara:strand:+ start:40150 stop:40674 length:525 start_codon:yes stop_codon:yes gene_type:complete